MEKIKGLVAATVFGTLPTSSALACMVCHTDSARAVRAAVFGKYFYQTLGTTLLPFFILVALALFIHGGNTK